MPATIRISFSPATNADRTACPAILLSAAGAAPSARWPCPWLTAVASACAWLASGVARSPLTMSPVSLVANSVP
jgi:hypothetical protein